MRFGLFYQAAEAIGQTHAERYGEMLDLIAFGDTLGFDVAWLAELHFGGAFSLLASPLMVVPVIAQRTRRIRIGTAVTLLPLHHPLSCAEQAATADVLSGRGRLGGAAARPKAAPADPRRRPHRRELRPHRRPRPGHLLRDDDHPAAPAARVHGALSSPPRRGGARVAARSDGADAARARRPDVGGGAGCDARRRAPVLPEPRG